MRTESGVAFFIFLYSCLVMSTSGSLFAFSAFSEDFRTKMGYSSIDINVISGVGNTAAYLSFLFAGPFYDVFGPRWTQFSGMLMYSIGYLLMWMTFDGKISGNVGSMAFYYFLAGSGSSIAYLVAVAINLVNFTNKRITGITLGILLLFYGLSATFYAQIYRFYYAQGEQVNTSGFLFFLFMSVAIVNSFGIICMKKIHVNKLEDEEVVSKSGGETASQIQKTVDIQRTEIIEETNTTSTSYIPPSSTSPQSPALNSAKKNGEDNLLILQDRNELPPEFLRSSNEVPSFPQQEQHQQEKISLKKTFKQRYAFISIFMSATFWAYALALIWQQGLTYISNVALIIRSVSPEESVSYIARESSFHVTLISVFQSIGRFLFGYLSQESIKFWFLDINFLLFFVQLILLVPPLILFLSSTPTSAILNICSICTGFGWGGAGGLFPGLISYYFGMKNYGTASGLLMGGVPIGILVSNQIFGVFYNEQASLSSPSSSSTNNATDNASTELVCVGVQCYKTAMIISFGIQLVPVVCSIWLFWRHFLLKKKLKHQD